MASSTIYVASQWEASIAANTAGMERAQNSQLLSKVNTVCQKEEEKGKRVRS